MDRAYVKRGRPPQAPGTGAVGYRSSGIKWNGGKVPDDVALELIELPGKLGSSGKRPPVTVSLRASDV